MKQTVAILLLIYTQILLACEPTIEQLKQIAERDRAIEEKYLTQLSLDAEYIFVGMVLDVSDSDHESYARVADIKIEHLIKGSSDSTVSALFDEINEKTETHKRVTSCDIPFDPSENMIHLIKDEKALFYVKDGVISRVTYFPVEPQLLGFNVNSEIEFIKNKVK